jgi:uncharacterized repeat protein (TIGR02543 family)
LAITVASGNPAYSSVDGVLFNLAKTTLIRCPQGKTGTYSIPNNVTCIEDYAFDTCSGLASVTIPSSVTSIGYQAFLSCTGLSSVTIPRSVTSIGGAAFFCCRGLASACFAGNAPAMGSSVFDYTAGDFTVYYTSGQTGFTTPTWNGYSAVSVNVGAAPVVTTADASGIIIRTASATLNGTVNPNGFITTAQFEYGLTTAYGSTASVTLSPANGMAVQTVSATLSGLQAGETYHYRLTANNSGGTSMGMDNTLTIPYPYNYTASGGTVTIDCYIGSGGVVSIPATIDGMPVTSIGSHAFDQRTNLTRVTIPSSVTSIGESAFVSCTTLTSVTFLNGVTSIGEYAFGGCTNLTSVTIPSSVTNIGSCAFSYCTNLTSVTFLNGVTSIGNSAFQDTNLTSVTIPGSVTYIGPFAFYSCKNLTSAYFLGNAPTFAGYDRYVFSGAASGFTIHYFTNATGFTTPTWNGYSTLIDFPPTAPMVTTHPANRDVHPGATATFTAAADGYPAPTVQWQVSASGTAGAFTNIDSTANTSAITGTLTLTNVTPAQDGVAYRAVFINSEGNCATTAATLTVLPASHTVTFHPGAHGSIAEANSGSDYVVTVAEGAAFPVVTVNPAAGWGFTGWTTAAPATVTDDFEATANYEITHIVTYDAAGGTVSPANKEVTFGAAYGELPIPTRVGYAFFGWYTGADGTGTEVMTSTVMTATEDHTLYAYWMENPYIVFFDAQGGTTPVPATKTLTFGAAYGSLASATRPGYFFAGWFTAPTEGSRVTDATRVTPASARHTLYARWTAGNTLPGCGTEADPYRIETRADFDAFCASDSQWAEGVHTRLDTDIDLAGTTYGAAPIAPNLNAPMFSGGRIQTVSEYL